jgi:hypothetical protein
MRSRFEVWVGLGLGLGLASGPATAGEGDATSGRIEGDVGLVAGAGATVAPRAPRGAFDLRLRYLETAGLFATYEDQALVGATSDPRRALSTGFELRPLFLARWLSGKEHGASTFVDLTLDSIGVELGAWFTQPAGASFGSRPGAQAGLELELPLFAKATGLWLALHGGLRWSDDALSGGRIETPSDRGGYLTITIAWHQLFVTHVVDEGDRAPQ